MPPAGAAPSGFSPPRPTDTAAPAAPNSSPSRTSAPQPPEAPTISPDAARDVLAKLEGTWDLAIRLYDRGSPQAATQGRSVFAPTLNGRFIREHFTGVFGAENIEGLGFTGFDEARGLFTMSWLDSSSGAISTALGSYDPDFETLTFAGLYEPGPGARPVETRTTITLDRDDRHLFTFKFVQPDGAELTVYEIVYRRADEP